MKWCVFYLFWDSKCTRSFLTHVDSAAATAAAAMCIWNLCWRNFCDIQEYYHTNSHTFRHRDIAVGDCFCCGYMCAMPCLRLCMWVYTSLRGVRITVYVCILALWQRTKCGNQAKWLLRRQVRQTDWRYSIGASEYTSHCVRATGSLLDAQRS